MGSGQMELVARRPPVAAGNPADKSPVEVTAGLLRGRWTAVILWHLFWGEKRFYQLLREVGGITRRALAHELEELERWGIVERRFRNPGPASIVYALTSVGETLKIVVGAMYEWGLQVRHRLPPGGRPGSQEPQALRSEAERGGIQGGG